MKARPLGLATTFPSVNASAKALAFMPAWRCTWEHGLHRIRAIVAHPKRLDGCDYRGQLRVFLTTCTKGKHRAFLEDSACEHVATQLLQCADEADIEVTVYCVMPDHVHALLRGRCDSSEITRTFGRWKQRTGYWFRRHHPGRLWEPGFWDRVVRGDDDPMYFLHYVVMNPVVAHLATAPENYRWIGSSCFSRAELIDKAISFELGKHVTL
jgi:putative transposase